MASQGAFLERQLAGTSQKLEVIRKLDPEAAARLVELYPEGRPPHSGVDQHQLLTFIVESDAVLANVLIQHVEANKPRPRGRPPKAA